MEQFHSVLVVSSRKLEIFKKRRIYAHINQKIKKKKKARGEKWNLDGTENFEE
jgi:hypothetical protein